jgi:hypothetical protein
MNSLQLYDQYVHGLYIFIPAVGIAAKPLALILSVIVTAELSVKDYLAHC